MELAQLIARIGFSVEEILSILEPPPSIDMGDIALPCFGLGKTRSKTPTALAKEIADFVTNLSEAKALVDRVEAVGGYVNLYFNKEKFSEQVLADVFRSDNRYGSNESGKGKKVIIEMSSPNIAKSFGIGHLRSTIIGEALSRIYRANGFQVIKINYLGDWGTQFGKLIYGFKEWGNDTELAKKPIDYLQDLYIKTNLEINEEIEATSRGYLKLMEEGDEEVLKLWHRVKKYSLVEFNRIYDLLGVSFDITTGESEYKESGKEIAHELLKNRIAKESEGAIVVDLEDSGNSVGMLIKSDGTSTYLSRDIAAAIKRNNEYEFDEMIYEVGSEQELHFQQMFTILKKMGYEWASHLKHVSHGLYLGKDGGKLSTRQGTSIKMMDIWDHVYSKIINELKTRGSVLDKNDLERAKKISRAAIIYADLNSHRESNIKYDLDSIVATDGNTGPYLLYSYARSRSILSVLNYTRPQKPVVAKPEHEEYQIISRLSEFSRAVLKARVEDDPSIIAKYSMNLARELSSFYERCRVKGSSREKYRSYIIDAYSCVLRISLNLIGIDVVERM